MSLVVALFSSVVRFSKRGRRGIQCPFDHVSGEQSGVDKGGSDGGGKRARKARKQEGTRTHTMRRTGIVRRRNWNRAGGLGDSESGVVESRTVYPSRSGSRECISYRGVRGVEGGGEAGEGETNSTRALALTVKVEITYRLSLRTRETPFSIRSKESKRIHGFGGLK